MKGKLGRVIFRRIGGRLIPIRISNVADAVATASSQTAKFRKIVAELPDKTRVGVMHLEIPKKGRAASVVAVNVEKTFRRKGVSKNLFARAQQFLSRAGRKFLRSEDLQHPAQVKIRKALGQGYKAGGKRKAGSRFFADQFGPYQEQTKRVTSEEARAILSKNRSGRQVKVTTKIYKRKK